MELPEGFKRVLNKDLSIANNFPDPGDVSIMVKTRDYIFVRELVKGMAEALEYIYEGVPKGSAIHRISELTLYQFKDWK